MKAWMALLCLAPLACTNTARSPGDRAFGELDRELIDVVAFETGCPHHLIEVVDRPDGHRQTFSVKACGREVEYQRTEAVFHTPDTRL